MFQENFSHEHWKKRLLASYYMKGLFKTLGWIGELVVNSESNATQGYGTDDKYGNGVCSNQRNFRWCLDTQNWFKWVDCGCYVWEWRGEKKDHTSVLELDLYCNWETTYVKKEMRTVDRPLLSSQRQMG